jgi:hypothetical protein
MPTTINQGFNKLRENLRITELQESTVANRQQNLRGYLDEELKIADSFLTGSYRRGTMIAPLSRADIDILFVLDPSHFQDGGQASLLDKVRRILRKIYPDTSEISRNGQAVTVQFTDFKVDVVPSFNRSGGGYIIADSILGRWIATDPKKHVQIWQAANQEHNCNLNPLSKMIKGWNRMHSRPFRTFHLEMLILQIMSGVTISSFPLAVGYVFDQARTLARYPVLDPAGYGGDVGAYLNNQAKLDAALSRLETAYRRAVEAIEYEEADKVTDAYDKWRIIFGDYFPAYG